MGVYTTETITSDTTITFASTTDLFYINVDGSADITITLPSLTAITADRSFRFKRIDSQVTSVTLNTVGGSEYFDDVAFNSFNIPNGVCLEIVALSSTSWSFLSFEYLP